MSNQPFDESLDVPGDSSSEEITTPATQQRYSTRHSILALPEPPAVAESTPIVPPFVTRESTDGGVSIVQEDEIVSGRLEREDSSFEAAPDRTGLHTSKTWNLEEEEEPRSSQDVLEHKRISSAVAKSRPMAAAGTRKASKTGSEVLPEPQEEEDSEGVEDSESDRSVATARGGYDPAEFMHLPVSTEVKDVFNFIEVYRLQTVEIEPVLKPFILDYIPAVGDIDAFIKIPRPDEIDDNLGLIVLDEPCAKQSDPTVLDLQMRAISKEAVPKGTVVKQLERADKNAKEIDQWIKNIGDLHKSKPATNVHYTKPMPDIDSLMQEWPHEFEEMLKRVELPTADMDMSLEQYIDLICNVLDIPVHKSRLQSLHVLFTLYSEFKNSQHFKSLAVDNKMDNALKPEDRKSEKADRLEL